MRRNAFVWIIMWIVMVLSLISAFAVGCNSSKDDKQEIGEGAAMQEEMSDNQIDQKSAKGRYREEKMNFPLPIKNIFDVECKENGNVKVLFENEPGSFFFYESMNYGVSWEQKEMRKEWLPPNYRVVSACFGAKGDIVLSAGKMSEDPLHEKHPIGEYSYFKINNVDGDMKAQPLSLQLPEPKEVNLESGYGLKQILLSDDGKIYGVFTSGDDEQINFQVFCFVVDNGKVLWELDADAAEIALFEDKIYLNEYRGTIKVLDANSGEKVADISIPLENNFLCCMDVQKDKIFYCNENGIYGTDHNVTLLELLVDERLSSFQDETWSIKGLFSVSEKVFLVFVQSFSGEEMEIFRYEYDANLPAQPEHELVVYSLKDNSVIQKIVADFQATHPEVFVRYEVGMSDSSVKDETDAISSLNTEIMAGNGPDVLSLNGLPWESYQEKGILENLSSGLEADMREDKVFENLFSAYQLDGSQYVIPISFKIPVLIGEENSISKVDSIEELLKTAENTEDLPPFFRNGQALLRYIFSIYWQRIEKEGGGVSKEELTAVLEKVKQINDVLQEKESELSDFFAGGEDGQNKNFDVFANDNSLDVWSIKYGNVAMDLGYLSCMEEFGNILNQGLSYQELSEGVFHALIAGINKGSKNKEIAEEFLAFALSDEEQKIFIDGMYMVIMGFPVNKSAFRDMISQPSQSELEEYGKGLANFDETFEWPGTEQFRQLEEKIENLDTPAMEDNIIISTILENAAPYLSGEKEVDVTVNEIAQSLELYLLER